MRFVRLTIWGIIFLATITANSQTAIYHLHKETSAINSSFDKLLTAGPDASSTSFTTILTNKTVNEYVIKEFETQSGIPNSAGVIPSGSTLNFSLWMRKTANVGTVFPRAKIRLNSATGTLLCTATGTTALTTTVTKQNISCTTSAAISMVATDRFYLWVGVNLTATSSTSFNGELDIEGTANGNFDSTTMLTLPIPAPAITFISPNTGAVGSSVVISGINFGSAPDSSTVKFNGVTATTTAWGSTSITATVPNGATTGPVVVTVNGQASAGVTFTVTAAPSITSLNPASGHAGSQVTISGTNFGASQGGGGVKFNGLDAIITNWSTSSIIALVPASASTGNVVVTADGGVASNGFAFTVFPSPAITGLSPNSASAGTVVSISGNSFGASQGSGTVTFNGVAAAITSWTDGSIQATVPSGATTGNLIVSSTSGGPSNAARLSVVNPVGVWIDQVVSSDTISALGNLSTAPLSTHAANELLLAFVSAGGGSDLNISVAGVSGGGLTWTLVQRTNTQRGTAEIWRAFASSVQNGISITASFESLPGGMLIAGAPGDMTMTVATFAGIDATGSNGAGAIGAIATANSGAGAPSATLTTTRNNSLVMGVGVDPQNFVTLLPGANQVILHQVGAPCDLGSCDTLWVQQQSTAISSSGTSVTINDTTPGFTDPFNVSLVEILPSITPTSGPVITSLSAFAGQPGATFTISGANFGSTQGTSTVKLNGTSAVPSSWSANTIVLPVPNGVSTGDVVVHVGTQDSNGSRYIVENSAGLATDAIASSDLFAESSVSTTEGNELLLAFISAGGHNSSSPTAVQTVSGGNLNWTLVQRTNTQLGTAEIWRALAPAILTNVAITADSGGQGLGLTSMTVVSFIGADTSGTNGAGAIGATASANAASGAPSASLITTRANSMVFGVGNDPSAATARTLGPNQTLLDLNLISAALQLQAPSTTWVQQQTSSIANSGTNVTINDTAPTADAYNLSIVEVLPPTNTAPNITSLLPASGPVGTSVTINGTNFGGTQGTSTVSFGGVNVTPGSWTSTAISIIVPQLPLGPALVTVTVPGAGASNSVTFTVVAPLAIILTPSPGANAAGWNNTNVTITYQCTGGVAPVQCPGSQTVPTESASEAVSATATDAIGESATATVTLKIDKTAPAVAITSPANNTTATSTTLQVRGNVSDALSGVASVTCNGAAATISAGTFSCNVTLSFGTNTVTATATDVAGNTSSSSITVSLKPVITSFNPTAATAGTVVTITGINLVLGTGGTQVTLNQQGGGTIAAPITSASATSVSFVIPAGAATGPVTITTAGQSATSAASLNVIASSSFSLTAGPATASVIRGTTAAFSVSLNSADGFSQLAALSVSGLPAGVTATFSPQQITAGQISILTVSAPAGQSLGTSPLTITASATVDGIASTQTANVNLAVQAVSTAFFGRILESDTIETPIPGIVATFLGKDDAGNSTGCSAQATSDAAGNFAFINLPTACLGRQLVGYNGNTSTDGEAYTSVNLAYTVISSQAIGPEIVHLPRTDNAETVMIHQNWPTDQIVTFSSIPNITVTVYAGTTLTMKDGTTPEPFPLKCVQVPIDRLPDVPIDGAGVLRAFLVALQPEDTVSSLPISLVWPNSLNTAPGVNMQLQTLDPIVGGFITYGTGTVSGDGSQIIPDLDPAHPGHRFGISHFDWHGPLCPTPNAKNPSPDPNAPKKGDPVDVATGLLVVEKFDIGFGGARGQVAINRTYRTLSNAAGPFGIGTNHDYSLALDVTQFIRLIAPIITLVMPDGNQFAFTEQPDGTFINGNIPTLIGAVITATLNDGLTGSYVMRTKNGTTYTFTTTVAAARTGFLTAITDTNGNVTTITRGGDRQQIAQITDPVGRSLNFRYDFFDRITSITDPLGRVVSYTYNNQGTLAAVTDPAGGMTSYGYDSLNRMTDITDARGILYLHTEYDANSMVSRQTAADGGVTQFSYTLLNPNATVTFNGAGQGGQFIVGGSAPISTSPVLLTAVIDPLGNKTIYHFNEQSYVIDITDALGEKTIYTRGSAN